MRIPPHPSRRSFLAASAALGIAAPGLVRAQAMDNSTEPDRQLSKTIRRNISSFRSLDWRPYFSDTTNGAILVDITCRALHFWSEDQSVYKLYPTSVPLTDDLTRLGRTEVVKKVVGPDWRPTPGDEETQPGLARLYRPPGRRIRSAPMRCICRWQFYRIHGTHDTRKIGRRSSNGCIGLYNEHIAELFGMCVGGHPGLLV